MKLCIPLLTIKSQHKERYSAFGVAFRWIRGHNQIREWIVRWPMTTVTDRDRAQLGLMNGGGRDTFSSEWKNCAMPNSCICKWHYNCNIPSILRRTKQHRTVTLLYWWWTNDWTRNDQRDKQTDRQTDRQWTTSTINTVTTLQSPVLFTIRILSYVGEAVDSAQSPLKPHPNSNGFLLGKYSLVSNFHLGRLIAANCSICICVVSCVVSGRHGWRLCVGGCVRACGVSAAVIV